MATERKMATPVPIPLRSYRGDARLYKLSPPISDRSWGTREPVSYDYVVVSAVDALFTGPETYIFGADADGTVLDWSELEGSLRGGLDHEAALRGAGYEVVNEEAVLVVHESAPREAIAS